MAAGEQVRVERRLAAILAADVAGYSRLIEVYRVPIDSSAVKAPLPLPDKPSLAVLPFQNLSGDPEQEYFVDGVVEEIITAISRLPWLFVIARNSSFAYKGKSPDLRQVGRELGVRYVLEGSLRKAGNRVRITGQLIDTTTGAHIWADRFDGVLDDIFEHLRALALRDTHTDESVAEAIDLLKRELAIDPNYAPAKALVGWSRAHQGSHGRSLPSEAERV